MAPSRRLPFLPRRRWLAALLVAVVLLLPAGWLAAIHTDRSGLEFVAAGKAALDALAAAAEGLEDGDAAPLAARLADGYRGRALGLAGPRPLSRRDGVEIYRFAGGGELGRQGAIDEWRRYLAGFERLDEVILHIHRLEAWDDPAAVVASVRFEVLGRLRGEAGPAADRGLLRMTFDVEGEEARITGAELVEGERQVGGAPHFVDVAPAAGVDFVNRYYPKFLDRPLAFAMLRYGPAGISAVDYDGDGFHDLFVPDGVAARLFRNRRDGTFEDVTAAAGLSGLSGVSVGVFADYDNDGHKDVFVSRTFEPNQIFHNRGDGTFEDVTARTGIGEDCCTTVASWADYDLDGDLDLYVGRYLDPHTEIPTTFYARNGEPNRLYRNDGGHRFTDVTEQAGVGEIGLCLGTVFGDYDDDGDPDLYVVNDFGRNTLYRNEGDGTFRDVSEESGTLAYGAGMSASFGDYDNDGRLDIYVANIRSDFAWFGEQPTVGRYLLNSIRQGALWEDYPLYLEIVRQSGFRFKEVFQQMGSGNTLLRNRGDGTFEDVTWAAGANPPGWFWGSSLADFDNDGWQDVYSTNGWVYGEKETEIELDFFSGITADQRLYKTGHFYDPAKFGGRSWHGWERNRHLRNEGDGTFREIGPASGADLLLNSRGIAVADFWNRGVLDIAVAASTDRHALLRNEVGGRRHWLAVEVEGAAAALERGSNRDGVGTRVELVTGGQRQVREVVLGDGYGSQNTLRVHFGLGEAESVDELVVRWPRSGIVQRFKGVAVDQILRVREGAPAIEEVRRERLQL
jgi:hypothetical protein